MAVSPVDIANLALDKLGQPPIVTFQDTSKQGLLCNRMYPLARDFIFRTFPWRRLRARAQLAADTEAPLFQYQFRFRLPMDLLRLLDVSSDSGTRDFFNGRGVMNQGWELEGEFILTNVQGPLNIRYIKKSEDPGQWDMLMIHSIAAYMAKDLAEVLTQDTSKKQFAANDYAAIMTQARQANAQEGNPVQLNNPDGWEVVRWAGGAADGFVSSSPST